MSTEAQKIKLKTPKKRSFLLEKVLPSKQSFLKYVFLSYMVLHLSKLKSWNETKVEFHHPPPRRAKCHTGDKKQGKEGCPDKRQRKDVAQECRLHHFPVKLGLSRSSFGSVPNKFQTESCGVRVMGD